MILFETDKHHRALGSFVNQSARCRFVRSLASESHRHGPEYRQKNRGMVFSGKMILHVGFHAVNDLVYLFRGTVDSGGDFDGC